MLSILLVDDEKDAVEALKMYFDLQGIPCWTASDGDEALKMIANQKPEVILLDVHLGGSHLSGLDVLREAKEKFPRSKVFMVTGFHDEASHEKARELGADGYLEKPLSAEKILQVIS